jgi:hypothetical protein
MLDLINGVPDDQWFVVPAGAVSHLGWQVGHLAMAEYGLTLLRIRDRQSGDNELIPKDFIRSFKKGSAPQSEATSYPSPEEIRTTLDRVHHRALVEMLGYTDEQLKQSLPAPTAVFPNKLGSLFFCSAHEMLHAGQIGALRRGLGMAPLR